MGKNGHNASTSGRGALIALVGRPNVGKSALFNAIIGERKAIVDESEGVTRDRLYARSDFFGRPFGLVDTGGITPKTTKGEFSSYITQQALYAIEEADSIIQVVDISIGVTPFDIEVSKILQRTKKPVCLAVNKVDSPERERELSQFLKLGIQPMVAVSALHRSNIAELLQEALSPVPLVELVEEPVLYPRVAIVGRPNVGKSQLVNTLLQEERCIVSPIAGTTRDSIHLDVEINEKPYRLIDTAGLRRKNKERDVIEKFAHIRTARAIEEADVCILLLDALQGLTTEDKKIAKLIEEAGKGCIVAFNKWDLAKGFRMEHALKQFEVENHFLQHCPALCISALTGRNLEKIFTCVDQVNEAMHQRISTGQLNKATIAWVQKYHPPVIQGRRLRIYYLTQVTSNPPKFILFINHPKLLEESYKRYLINQLRKTFNFTGVPLQLLLRGKEERDSDGKRERSSTPRKVHDRDMRYLEEQESETELEQAEFAEGEE